MIASSIFRTSSEASFEEAIKSLILPLRWKRILKQLNQSNKMCTTIVVCTYSFDYSLILLPLLNSLTLTSIDLHENRLYEILSMQAIITLSDP